MNITTNDNSLAWTVSDKTSGSSKQKRAGKVKAASGSQDVLSNTITKYLGDSVKFENSNTARQLTLQEEQLKLEQRKMDLLEKQHADRQRYDRLAPDHHQQYDDRQGYRYGRPASDHQQQDDRQGYRYGRPASDHQQYDDYQGYRYGRPASDHQQQDDRQGYRFGRPTSDHQQCDDYQGYFYGRPPSEHQQQDDRPLPGKRWTTYGDTYDELALGQPRDRQGRVGNHLHL